MGHRRRAPEDVPRLIYADWLEEFAPERVGLAKYIRAAVRVAQGYPKDKPRYPGLGGASWLGPEHIEMRKYRDALRAYNAQRKEFEDACVERGRNWDAAYKACLLKGGTGLDTWRCNFEKDDWDRGLPFGMPTRMAAWVALGPTIVRRIPLTELIFEDKKPWRSWDFTWVRDSDSTDPRRWMENRSTMRFPDEAEKERARVPDCIYAFMEHYAASVTKFSVEKNALTALSDAALMWARHPGPAPEPEPDSA